MKNNVTDKVMQIVFNYAGVKTEEVFDRNEIFCDGLWELTFCADNLKYDAYVDAQSGEVLGFSFEPIPMGALTEEQYAA